MSPALPSEDEKRMIGLVPGRECGTCKVCCIVPTIDTPAHQKKPGAVCRHCETGPGCSIYAERPQVCRTFICAWRTMGIFGPEWQPDKCGVMVEIQTHGIPVQFTKKTAFCFTLIANPLRTVRQPWFIDFIATGVANNTPLFLAVPGPAGHVAAKIVLNSKEMAEAAAQSRSRVKQVLEQILRSLSTHQFSQYAFRHHGNDIGVK
jgi:hypothetical protein